MLRHRSLSVCAVLAVAASAAWAQTAQEVEGTPKPESTVTPAEQVAPRRPLMAAFEQIGLAKPLDDLGINIYGHVEGSYTWNFDNPSGDTNVGRVFDMEHDELNLNQVDITVERAVDYTKNKFDVGGRMEWLYGTDAGLVHTNGLFDWYDGPRDPENQFDLHQLYLDITLPIFNGARVRAGKFTTIIGYETVNPTTTPLFSRSYLFNYGPFMHTGVLFTTDVVEGVTVTAGITRGWEQSLEDNNSAIDFLGSINWKVNDKLNLYFANSTGPQIPDDTAHYRTLFDFIASYAYSDQISLAINADYAYEWDTPGLGTSSWYGAAGYLGYKLSDYATLNTRLEVFSDDNANRGFGTTIYAATLGVAITPFANDALLSNFKIRPEIRYDWAQKQIFDGDSDQFTAAMDAIFTF